MKFFARRKIKVEYRGFTGTYDTEQVPPKPFIIFHNFYVKKGKQVLLHKVYCDDAQNVNAKVLLAMTKEFVDKKFGVELDKEQQFLQNTKIIMQGV